MSEQYLVAQGEHARREDGTGAARVRAGAVPGTSLGWSVLDGPVPEPRPTHDSRYDAAHRSFLGARGGRQRGRCPLGLHLEVNVSPGWIEEGGNLHDPANPRIRAHWDAVVAWAREVFGDALFALRVDLDETGGGVMDALFALRVDLDETGGGVMDAFVAPLRRLGHKAKGEASAGGRLWVSVNRAMEELTTRFGHRKSENWSAINTSWAAHAKEHLDPRLCRGEPKRLTGRRHVPIDEIRLAHAALDAEEAALEERVADLDCRAAVVAEVVAATLAGRIDADADGEPAVRPGWAPAGGEPPATPGEDDILRQDLRIVEDGHGAAVRAALAFVGRLLRLDLDRAVPATVTASREAKTGALAAATPGAELEAETDADDPFAVPDPTAMVPRPW